MSDTPTVESVGLFLLCSSNPKGILAVTEAVGAPHMSELMGFVQTDVVHIILIGLGALASIIAIVTAIHQLRQRHRSRSITPARPALGPTDAPGPLYGAKFYDQSAQHAFFGSSSAHDAEFHDESAQKSRFSGTAGKRARFSDRSGKDSVAE